MSISSVLQDPEKHDDQQAAMPADHKEETDFQFRRRNWQDSPEQRCDFKWCQFRKRMEVWSPVCQVQYWLWKANKQKHFQVQEKNQELKSSVYRPVESWALNWFLILLPDGLLHKLHIKHKLEGTSMVNVSGLRKPFSLYYALSYT